MSIDTEFDRQHLWHPYTSMIDPLPCYPVSRTQGVYIHLEDGTALIDGMASWWSAIHGYGHPELTQAAKAQLDTMSHVMFGGLTHAPAIEVGKKLVAMTGLDKVFLADSGSVAVEVALKMAIQYWHSKGKPAKNRMLSLHNGYHGDTFGAMAVCDPVNGMHELYQGILPQHFFVPAPQTAFGAPWDPQDIAAMRNTLLQHRNEIAAIILEPVVQGAGGMRIYHPEYVRQVRQLCDEFEVLFIADEIATGFGRTGTLFGCEHADVKPDILCLGKALTGGYMSLAATLCSEKVALGISEGEAKVLMHGPTFMGNPLACAVASASLDLIQQGHWQSQVRAIETQLNTELFACESLECVKEVRVLGAIGVIETHEPVNVAEVQQRGIEAGIWVRPFGRLVYIMPPYVITSQQLTQLTQGLYQALA